MKVNRTGVVVAAVVVGLAAGLARAQAPSRLSDKDVKALMEQTDQGLRRFVDGMDRQIRRAVLRGQRGEVDVQAFLKDFQEDIRRMRDRFHPPDYNAGAETVQVLRQAKRLDEGIRLRPALSGADAKWHDVVPLFTRLAGAYNVDWQGNPETWTTARVSDRDLKNAATALRKASEAFGKNLGNTVKRDKSLDAAARQRATSTSAALTTAAKGLEELVKRKTDASVAVDRVIAAAADARAFVNGYAGGVALGPPLAAVDAQVDIVAKAYGRSR